MNCPRCGTVNLDTSVFCSGCGTKLTKSDPALDSRLIHTMPTPPGFEAGVFPRDQLIGGEVLYWEGRAALIAYIGGGVIALIISLFLLIIFSDINIFVFIISLMALYSLIKIVMGIASWANAAFALTDKRVMARYGVFTKKYSECYHDKIQNIVVIMPFLLRLFGNGTLTFATSGFMGGINTKSANKMQSSGGAIVWNGVRSPNEVKRYAVDIIEQTRKQAKKAELDEMAVALREGKITEAEVMSEASRSVGARTTRTMSTEERLLEAKGLKEKNLITQEEYEEMRKRIMAEC